MIARVPYNPIKNDLYLNIICDGNGNQYCQNAENEVCPYLIEINRVGDNILLSRSSRCQDNHPSRT